MFCCGAFLEPQQDCFLASNAYGESERLLGICLDRVPAEVALCTSETVVIRSHVFVGGCYTWEIYYRRSFASLCPGESLAHKSTLSSRRSSRSSSDTHDALRREHTARISRVDHRHRLHRHKPVTIPPTPPMTWQESKLHTQESGLHVLGRARHTLPIHAPPDRGGYYAIRGLPHS